MKCNCLVVVVTLSLLLGLGAQADERKEIERQLNQTFKGKVVTLRHFYKGERLRFDSDGNLLKGGETGPWTLCGKVEIKGIKLRKNELEINGNRLFLLYDKGEQDFRYSRDGKVQIEIALSQDPLNSAGILESFKGIFFVPEENLWEIVPDYWHHFLKAKSAVDTGANQFESIGKTEAENFPTSDRTPYKIGGAVSPPSCISCSDPEYTEAARRARLEGTMVLWVIVNEEGKAERFRIREPFGMGLDDAAVEAVREWEFRPAMRDGKPVPVYMTIEVNYHLYKRR